MHSLLVAQSYSKYLPFLLMSESSCLPITPFHVLLLVFTCAFKPPFVDSANATFCKATPTLSKEGLDKVGVALQKLVLVLRFSVWCAHLQNAQ